MDLKKQVVAVLCLFGFAVGPLFSQDYESIDGAMIYDHDLQQNYVMMFSEHSSPMWTITFPAETPMVGPCAWSIPTVRSWRSIRIQAAIIWMVGVNMP